MALRDLPDNFSGQTVKEIDECLRGICAAHRVAIPLAIESGSRAWGFPSPDSDYDCRFIFVRSINEHISPWRARDVIETPLQGDLDVNGWELGKAIKLLLKGNAVIIEWLRSPVIYQGDEWFRDEFLSFATRFANRDLIGRHYLHLGERQRRVYFEDGRNVPQKKIFYALRPAATLRWMRMHPAMPIAPMHFPSLMVECDPPSDVAALTADLMARKAVTRELGTEPLPSPIAAFIDNEFTIGRTCFERGHAALSDEARKEAESFYRKATRRFDPLIP